MKSTLASYRFSSAIFRPSPTNTAPHSFRMSAIIFGLFRSASDRAEAANARTMHQTVPVVSNVQPRMKNGIGLSTAFGFINCGRKERKNKATFGLSRLVRNPCA